jgi:hypothetical protein
MHDPLNAASRERNSRTGYSLSTNMYHIRVKRPLEAGKRRIERSEQ